MSHVSQNPCLHTPVSLCPIGVPSASQTRVAVRTTTVNPSPFYSQPGIGWFSLHSEYGENGFMATPQRFVGDQTVDGFQAEGVFPYGQ